MRKATLAQRNKLWNLIEQEGTPREQLQMLLASGLFPDLLNANFHKPIDREKFRKLLGLKTTKRPFEESGELGLYIPSLPQPTLEEMQLAFPEEKIKRIVRDASPVTAVIADLAIMSQRQKGYVDIEDLETRMAGFLQNCLGYQHALWICGRLSQYNVSRERYIVFAGLMLESDYENRLSYPYISFDHDEEEALGWKTGLYDIEENPLNFEKSDCVAVAPKSI